MCTAKQLMNIQRPFFQELPTPFNWDYGKLGFRFYFLLDSAIIRMKWPPTIVGFKNSEGNWYQEDLVVTKNSSGIRD